MSSQQTPAAELPDEELVARAQTGEARSFATLLRRHGPSVLRVIRRVVHDESAVEDAMQDTYVSAFAHLNELSGAGAFPAWLRRIAFRKALHRVRRARASPFSELALDSLEPASPLASPEGAARRAELRVALEAAIGSLPDGAREVFILRSIDGCSVAETATVLGVRAQTVQTRLFRARAKLQQALGFWVDHESPGAFSFACG